ncbi:MAG: PRC-barrel domain-containing protein [Omnitrophica WOR_2 bacterium]
MQFKKDAEVVTADGKQVGHIDRVVIDPRNNQVTGVVVRKGILFTSDKVVPIDLIGSSEEDRVSLLPDTGELDDLPEYMETHYVPAYDQKSQAPVPPEIPYAPSMYPNPPLSGGGLIPGYGTGMPTVLYREEVEPNIPPGTVALKEGARVISADGQHVGDVARVITAENTDRVTHFLVSHGLLQKERKLIPVQWVQTVTDKEVTLAVGTRLLDTIKPVEM